ncbi:MAG: YkoF family thiamine/hydroxymethylpyrimidine-binding protein [Candidatus Lernaella stagnicola]|nr:YkoF family thiamine/hydroxymethylpyrimidine-binding protein [Candidatus Lernaella stagnicola]
MKIQAELSLYPLRTDLLERKVAGFIEQLIETGLTVVPGSMSTTVSGENEAVFRGLSRCFEAVSEQSEVVLIAKISNACPAVAGDVKTKP